MDINDLRGIATLLVMIAFIGVCIWAYSSKRKSRFEEAAQLPFSDEDDIPRSSAGEEKNKDDE